MFLYVQIVLDNIELFTDIEEIRNELRVLPESLNKAYDTSTFQSYQRADPFIDTRESFEESTALNLPSERNVGCFLGGPAVHQLL